MKKLSASHRRLKATRGRGSETQNHLAAVHYLKELEQELIVVQEKLFEAWKDLESNKNFRKFLKHSDHAQQRLHRAIKRL